MKDHPTDCDDLSCSFHGHLHYHLERAPGKTILEEAKDLVYGSREQDYGDAADDMRRVAEMWSAILGARIRPEQVPLCMIAIKIARLHVSLKRDSVVDIAGWAAVLERVAEKNGWKNVS